MSLNQNAAGERHVFGHRQAVAPVTTSIGVNDFRARVLESFSKNIMHPYAGPWVQGGAEIG